MKKGFFLIFTVIFPGLVFSAKLTQMNFYQTGEVSQLEFVFDETNIKASKFHLTNDKQIIVDLSDVTATERVKRAFDTSEFSGSVVFVSAYKKNSNPKDVRVAIQLRDNVRSILERRSDRIVLNIENRFGVFTQAQLDNQKPIDDAVNDPAISNVNIPKSNSIEDILDNLTMSGKKKYVGKRISINVKNVSVQDVLKMIADASGFNIIITDDIKKLPPLTLALNNVPWDQALDTIFELNKLVASKNGGILTVVTLDQATNDKRKEIEAKKVVQQQEPLVTKIFPVSFGEIGALEKIVKDYLTSGRGKINKDDRTNYLIVKDTVDSIEKIKRILETLDTATPQVLIETKIVDVQENVTKELGLTEGIKFGYDPITAKENLVDTGPGFSFSSVGSSTTGSAIGLNVATFGRVLGLNFDLKLLESEDKLKIISNPRIITQNKQTASINATDTDYYLEAGQTDGGGISSEWKAVSKSLKLSVTPQITNDGSISLDVNITKQEFGGTKGGGANAPPLTFSRDIKTQVLVDNGSTAVIGGIYRQSDTESHRGIPFLKDLPIVGWLFRTYYNPAKSKTELIIFLTPRIINQDEAGLGERI